MIYDTRIVRMNLLVGYSLLVTQLFLLPSNLVVESKGILDDGIDHPLDDCSFAICNVSPGRLKRHLLSIVVSSSSRKLLSFHRR